MYISKDWAWSTFFQDLGFRGVMGYESRTASCLGLEKEESEEMNTPFTVVSTTNFLSHL